MKSKIFHKKKSIFEKKWIFISIFFILILFLEKKYTILPIESKYIDFTILFYIIGIISIFIKKKYSLIVSFFNKIQAEIKTITWSTKKETFNTTLIIIALSIFISIILWGIDSFIFYLISFITSFKYCGK